MFETIFTEADFSRPKILRKWFGLALIASLAQLGFGPLNLFTLPWHAVTWTLVILLLTGASLAITAMVLIWRELKGPDEELGKRFYLIAVILTITVLFMEQAGMCIGPLPWRPTRNQGAFLKNAILPPAPKKLLIN